MFDRFARGSTASHSGSGLGLALVAQQAECMAAQRLWPPVRSAAPNWCCSWRDGPDLSVVGPYRSALYRSARFCNRT